MCVISTAKEILSASTQNPNRGDEAMESSGAYWCHDCGERVLDVEGESPPSCSTCGEEVAFERSAGSTGCAC